MDRSRSQCCRVFGLAALLGLAVAGCQGTTGSPTAPSISIAALRPDVAALSFGGHAVPLTEVTGSVPAGGAGTLNDTQTNKPGFNNFEVTVNVHGGPPDTDLYLQFVADIDPATRGDGVCPTPFPAPPASTINVLHTSAGGTASAHVKFVVPEGVFGGAFDSGVSVDFRWRVVNLAQTFDLRTPCVVLTGK